LSFILFNGLYITLKRLEHKEQAPMQDSTKLAIQRIRYGTKTLPYANYSSL